MASKMYDGLEVKTKPSKNKEPEPKTIQERLQKAKKELAQKVSIAGFKDAFEEQIVWIRNIFRLALIILTCCSIYYISRVIKEWNRNNYTNEISEITNAEWLPFSNVTVCAQVYVNQTFIRQNIIIPTHVAKVYKHETGKDIEELYHQLTLFLLYTTRPRYFQPNMIAYFYKILRANPQTEDYSTFFKAMMPTCESMLKNCYFNEKRFDCCEKAVMATDDDGVCYLFKLNQDSDNAAPSNLTLKQTSPGPKGGLQFDVSVPTKDIPWYDDDASNGFHVYVNAIPVGWVQSPSTAPHASETFIRVRAGKTNLIKNCAPYNHLSIDADPTFYHDPEGFSCLFSSLYSTFRKRIPCHYQSATYFPNQSVICHPGYLVLTNSILSATDLEKEYNRLYTVNSNYSQKNESEKIAGNDKQREKFIADLENDMKASFSNKARCLTHCVRWEYSSTSSFIDLKMREKPNSTKIMFSRIHVYYGDFDYRHHQEVKQISDYLAFCNFGNVCVLYLGMSIISFFDLGFYFVRYLYVWRLSRKGRRKNKRNRVSPEIIISRV